MVSQRGGKINLKFLPFYTDINVGPNNYFFSRRKFVGPFFESSTKSRKMCFTMPFSDQFSRVVFFFVAWCVKNLVSMTENNEVNFVQTPASKNLNCKSLKNTSNEFT